MNKTELLTLINNNAGEIPEPKLEEMVKQYFHSSYLASVLFQALSN